MKKYCPLLMLLIAIGTNGIAQTEPDAGNWKTWLISSGKDYRLPAPGSYKDEILQVVKAQEHLDSASRQQIAFWNAGAPAYRWQEIMGRLWIADTSRNGPLANMLMSVAIYDATVAAWDTKYAYKRLRPYAADKKIKLLVGQPGSPSYPCEHAVAAGVAATVIGHFYPALKDSVNRMAQRAMTSRIAAGVSFPSDVRAGFDLGKQIAEKEIESTKGYVSNAVWDGKMPAGPAYWRGKTPLSPTAGLNKTMVLTSGDQFRPGPPPDFAKEMEEMKKYKQNFRSQANAFYYATINFGGGDELLNRKIFEYDLQKNAPRVARIYATTAVAAYDAVIACWDAKYAYWGIRPDQYDTTFKPLLPTPPFPGYPSGHAVMSGMVGELYSYFFPAERALFQRRAKEGAESRFQGGIHFRTDNEVGLDLGRKIAGVVIDKIKKDGADK
jgi:membrane-associated phospholipid phosphatase